MQTIFEGEINGVKYNTAEEFYKALDSMKIEDMHSVHLNQKRVADEQQAQPSQKTQNDPVLALANFFAGLYSAFEDSLKGHNAPVRKEFPQGQPAADSRKITLEELKEKFIFKPTTYDFTGEEQDDIELDKFDGLLARLREEFTNIDEDAVERKVVNEFIELLKEEFVRTGKNIKELEAKTNELEQKIDKYTELIKLFEDLDEDEIDDYRDKSARLRKEFDKEFNRKCYNELLHVYYRDIISMIYH